MKSRKILIAILIAIMVVLSGSIKVHAASTEIYASNTTVEVGEDVTITAKFTAASWNIKVSGNGISGNSYASQTSDLSEAENVKTFKLDTSVAGTYTITISGDITDANGDTKEVSQSCTVTVKEKTVTPEPTPEPEPEPTPEPEKPTVVETPNFTDTNKTMYASKDNMNLRASWSITSAATKVDKGTELIVTATSTNLVDGYVWYRVKYNGQTLYVASNLLTNTKPEEEQLPEENEPTPEPVDENTKLEDEDEVKEGLSNLEIEGITLTPAFNPEIFEYKAIIKENLSELIINAVPVLEGATITIAGNKNITEGQNLITIIVYNVNGAVEATYQISVNKNTLDLSSTDEILKIGNKEARKNLIIFIVLLVVALVALIVVMILKRRNTVYEDDYEEEELYDKDFSNNEQITENTEDEITQEEIEQEEIQKPRRDKRKGKHF